MNTAINILARQNMNKSLSSWKLVVSQEGLNSILVISSRVMYAYKQGSNWSNGLSTGQICNKFLFRVIRQQ
jgi:hypothetical protein